MAEHCYRHPDRETAVSCSNCGRPICPDCMTSTPVGMRCPECARQKTKVRSGSAAYGRSGSMPATYVLIGLNVIAFVAELAGGLGTTIDKFGTFGPDVSSEPYRIVTGAFLHADLIHIGFNMLALYFLGSLLEPAIGTARFVALYIASLLAGSLGVLIVSHDTLSVGASGAIFGLFAAAFVIARGRGLDEIARQLGFLFVINLVITFGVPHISVGAHVGGAIGGFICGMVFAAGDRGMLGANRFTVELAVCSILAIAAAAAAFAIA